MAGVILAGGPSAPGVDGLPYEIYLYGLHFCASLLAQFQYAATGRWGEFELSWVLGESVDLLVWIPK
eukprot:9189843-Alexandrium_andersonii.AAC.1